MLDECNRRTTDSVMYAWKVFVWSSVHIMLQEAEKKKHGVGMALDVATLPLILYRKPGI